MPPKDAKKGSEKKPSTAGGAVNKNWETGLIKAEFEEDSWRASVSVVVGRSPEEEEDLVQALALAVQQPQRKLFTLLTSDDVLAKIHELGNPKAKKPDDAPMFYQVVEPAKLLLDAGEEIPCDLMAKVLKFHLLLIKAGDQESSDADQAEGENTIPDKKRKGPHTPVILPKEKKTTLKRRGDVEPPAFKDDEPEWGPQHYILLLGFYQPHLIVGLDAIGVHVSNVIKLCLERPQNIEGRQERGSCEGSEQRLGDSAVLDAEAVQARKLDLFWSGLRPVLDSGPPDSKLHDVVQLSYTVPDFMLDFHAQDPETVLALGSQVFDGVATLIYDCLNVRGQYRQYRHNLRLIDVPAVSLYPEPVEVVPAVLTTPLSKKKPVQEEVATDQKARLAPLSVDVDMCYYNNLLDRAPPEACSVPLILHCMLEQVVMSAEQPLSTLPHMAEESKPLSGPWLDHQLVSYMLQSFLPLMHTEEERHYLLNNLLTTVQNEEEKKRLVAKFGARETEKETEQPLVIRHHDERALRFRDTGVLQDFDPVEVESSMVRRSPVWELIESAAQQKERKSCWMSIKQQLQHYCTDGDVLWPEVERFFHLSVFEAMPLTRVDQQGVLLGTPNPAQQQPSTVLPWDDPLSFAKQQLHNMRNKGATFLTEEPGNREEYSGRVCSHLDLSDIQSCRLRSLFHWHYAEHHNATVLPQVLQSASEEYRCLDTFRGSHNNILYIFCHNPMSPHRQSKEFWDVALHTDVKFRNYFEHVADKVSDWTREEELKREPNQHRNNSQKFDSPKDEKTVCSAKEEDSVAAFIRKDSLKAWKLEQERQKEEVIGKMSKKEDSPKDKQQKKEDKSSDSKKQKTSSGGTRSRPETASSSAKPPTESAVTTAPPVDENIELQQAEEPFNGFIGYSMEGKLIHLSGCLQHLFPSDGGHITVESVSFVQGSSQTKVAVKKDGHEFYTHINQVVAEPAKHPPQTQHNKTTEPEKDCRGEAAICVTAPVEIKTVKQGSLSAVLDNRIRLSYSFYGPTGEYKVISPEAKDQVPDTPNLNPIPLTSSTRRSKGRDLESVPSETQATSSQSRPPESQGSEGQPAAQSSPFSSLSLSVPNGLLLQFLREDVQGEEKSILVRQSFPLHIREKARHLQDAASSKELSRVITSQGAVIRYMRDGSTEVLFADGSVSFSQDSGPVWVSESKVQGEISNQESEDSKEEQSSKDRAEDHRGCWLTTTPCGARICTVGTTHRHIPTKSLLTVKATDPITRQVMLNREDLVVCVQNPDGCVTVEHADGTRISSLFQERPLATNTHCSLHAGAQPGSVTLKSACRSASVAEDINVKSTCINGEISRNSAGNTCDSEGTVHGCKTLNECGCMCDDKESPESSVRENGEQSVFAEDTVTQNVCESHEGNPSANERMVLVEKQGCATVVMYPERQTARVVLADGTLITGNSRGEYEVFPSSVGLLHIRSDGTCVYSSDPLVTPSPKGSPATDQPGIYTMSHADKVACEVTDPDGNHFQVMEDGQTSVLNLSPAPSALEQIEEEEEEEDSETERPRVKIRKHRPRLFVVREDGSGTELLSSQTAEELLYQAYSDPTIALLKEQLPNTQDEFGITILKPAHHSVWSQWLLKKQNPDITPPNLRNRSWHDFPAKNPGPPFGTDVTCDLSLRRRPGGCAAQHQHVRNCPKVLELRELYQHRPFTTSLKNTIDSRLKECIESLMEREQRSEAVKVKDPRSEESAHASDLINLILSFPGEDDANHATDRRISEDVASLYSRGIGPRTEQSDVSEDVATAASDSLGKLKSCAKEKDSKWTERLAQYRQEMREEKLFREALRKKSVVPFFHPENIPLYESLLQQQVPDMRALSMDLPPFPKPDSAEGLLKDAPHEDTPRPLNPTPSQSASHSAGSSRVPKKRPTNPTPQSAGESRRKRSPRQCKSPQLDAAGHPRQPTARLPSSLLSSKPLNASFLTAEGPVRRKRQTISTSDAIVRGFELLPSSVDFGTLKEGTSSAITVAMKNVGVDRCRFHVKQPPPATGLRVVYSPGPVAAGLQVELQVQLFAVCDVQAGEVEPKKFISQEIIIHTEKEILHLPVTATILPERLYEIWLKDHPRAQRKNSSRSHAQLSRDQSCSKRRTY